MKFNKAIVAMILAIVMIMGLASAAMAEDANTITMAVIGPFTGPAANYGLACQYGAQVAADEINAQGGLQIKLVPLDDKHDPEESVNAFNYAIGNEGAQMVVGTTTTQPCIAVGDEANEKRVFMLTPSASSELVVADKDNVYQVCFQDPQMGIIPANLIKDNAMGTKVAIIYNIADDYSTGIYNAFKEEAANIGLEIVSETTFLADDNADFSVQVADAKDNGADLVFLPIYYTPASNIIRTARSMDYNPVFFGVDGMDGILALEGFDASLAEDVMLLTPFSAYDTDERVVNFVEKYEQLPENTEHVTPNQFGADAYDAVYALYQASVAAGIIGETPYDEACELLIAEFQKDDFQVDGLTGLASWDETGAVSKDPAVYVIKDGAYVPYGE